MIRPNPVRGVMPAIIAAATAESRRVSRTPYTPGTAQRATVTLTSMKKLSALVAVALGMAALRPAAARAQDQSPLAGVWTLNRSLSELPREIGFNVGWMPAPDTGQSPGATSRGRRGSSSGGGGDRSSAVPNSMPRESSEDARRLQVVTGEARNPPVRLMLVDTGTAVTITTELGQSRTLHPTGRPESLEIQGVQFIATTKRDGDQLVTVYDVEAGRTVRYAYSHSSKPPQLVVEVQFLEKGAGDKARRVYDAGVTSETTSNSSAPSNAPGHRRSRARHRRPARRRRKRSMRGLAPNCGGSLRSASSSRISARRPSRAD